MHQYNRSLSDYSDMPLIDKEMLKDLKNSFTVEETSYDEEKEQRKHESLFGSLNDEQRVIFRKVIDSIEF